VTGNRGLRPPRGSRHPLATVLATAVFLLSACDPYGFGARRLESEAELRRRFEAQRPALEEILRLAREDSHLVRIAPGFTRLEGDWSWPREDVGLTPERWDRYRALFERAGVADGIDVQESGDVFFYVSGVGLGISGASRGFVYCATPPSPVMQSIDGFRGDGIVYAALAPRWFLFHWNEI